MEPLEVVSGLMRAITVTAMGAKPLEKRSDLPLWIYSFEGWEMASLKATIFIPNTPTTESFMMFELSTPRLVLRDFVADDWLTMYAMSQAPGVIRYQSWLRLSDQADARDWVRQAIYHNQLQPRQAYNLAVVHATSRDVLGWLGWGRTSDRSRGDYNFGYALLAEAWNHGYMTEALQAGLQYMFEALSASYITGECARSNRGSARVMEKVGMRLVDEWEETNVETSLTETHCRYGLQVEQWNVFQRDQAQTT